MKTIKFSEREEVKTSYSVVLTEAQYKRFQLMSDDTKHVFLLDHNPNIIGQDRLTFSDVEIE